MSIKQVEEWFEVDPRNILLIDALGAIVSIVLLGCVLVKLEPFFGFPKSALYFLVLFPCIYFTYDLYVYYKKNYKVKLALKTIAFLNIVYCFVTLGLATYHWQRITALGWTYLVLELIVIVGIAKFEFNYSKKVN